MQLEISKNVVHWLYDECFPMFLSFAHVRIQLHNYPDNVEYYTNIIVKYTLENVISKFSRKYGKIPLHYKIKLEPAEIICLYRFLFNYSIPEKQHWRIQQRQFLIDQLHKGMEDFAIQYHNSQQQHTS